MEHEDVEILVPGREEDEELMEKLHAKEIKSMLIKVGITQAVLGVPLIIGGIIVAVSWPEWGDDGYSEGIWCGGFVLFAGPFSIIAYFYLHISMVITCLVMNILSSLLLVTGVVMAGISTIVNSVEPRHPSSIQWAVGFTVLNMAMVACLTLSIYVIILYVRILSQKRQQCCNWYKQGSHHNYTMMYVPTPGHVPEHMKNIAPESGNSSAAADGVPSGSAMSPSEDVSYSQPWPK